jgi:oxaloacetate decarboxylase alpha subunit
VKSKAYCRGEYGRTPAPIEPEFKKHSWDTPVVDGALRTAWPRLLNKRMPNLGEMARSDEDVLFYIAFRRFAEKFFKRPESSGENVVKYTIEPVE